jgi:hypothetical protein
VCDSGETLIIAVLVSVARKHLVKTEDFYVSGDYNDNRSVWFSGTDVRTAHINSVLSEMNEWNTKYLRNLDNHINALSVNLLDNSEIMHRLKRYIVVNCTRQI